MSQSSSGVVAPRAAVNACIARHVGSYAVDPVARTVTFTKLDGNPGPATTTLVLGPNADVILGAGTEEGGQIAEVLVLARAGASLP